MNAYELAKELDKYKGIATKQASDMLRQQADRIAELEDRLSMYEIKDLDRGIIGRTKDYVIHDLVHRTTPQIKDLSDEEIYKLAGEFWIDGSFDDGELDYVGFARAILKKAMEK